MLRLVDRADALIEGFRPGVLARLSLGWETLHARNPRLVLCSLSGYGQSGPLSQRAGHDLNYIAMTGVLDQIRAGGKFAIPNLQIGDLLGGTLSALATMLIAMLGAQRSGQGHLCYQFPRLLNRVQTSRVPALDQSLQLRPFLAVQRAQHISVALLAKEFLFHH